MKRMKIAVLFMFVVFLGANVANLHLISTLMPKSTNCFNHRGEAPLSQPLPQRIIPELDYHTLLEISEYLCAEASCNGFEITTIVYSAALLIESKEALILIGHGHFNTTGSYFIGTFSEQRIEQFAQGKEFVALLACYSATIDLADKMALTFNGKIDLKFAMEELITKLGWVKSQAFNPTYNTMLFDLDPGGCNGWSLENPPPIFNTMRLAYSYLDKDLYWDLSTDAGIETLAAWMLNHKYRLVKFTFKGEFLTQVTPDQNSYYINTYVVKYNAWVQTESDTNDYLHVESIYVNGKKQRPSSFNINIDEMVHTLSISAGQAAGIGAMCTLATLLMSLGMFLLAKGCKLISIAILAASTGTIATLTSIGLSAGWTALLGGIAASIGLICIVASITICIVAIVIAFNW